MRPCWILFALAPLAACASSPGRSAAAARAEFALAAPDPAPMPEPVLAPEPASVPAAPAAEPEPTPAEAWGPWLASEPAGAQEPGRTADKLVWRPGEALAQGWLGVTSLTSSGRTDSSISGPDTGDLDAGSLPVIGGGGQWKIAGEGVDLGLEAGINFGFQTDGGFIATGSNGATVAVSFDTLLFDLYGGAFISKYLGQKVRIYGSAGPLLQWASYDQSSVDAAFDGDGSGFGYGYYVRAGLEFVISRGMMIGFSGRWFDTEVDLSGDLGDWDLAGAQLLFTATRSF